MVTAEKSSGRAVCQQMIVEYETASEAHKAIKYMNGGMYNCIWHNNYNYNSHTPFKAPFFQVNLGQLTVSSALS